MPLRNVVLVDGARTAFARGAKGKLVATRLDDAGAQVVRALLDRNPKVKDSIRAQTPTLTRHPTSAAASDIEALAKGLLAD